MQGDVAASAVASALEALGLRKPQVLEGATGGLPSARSSDDEPLLQQEGLVHVLQGARVLAQRARQRGKAHRLAAKGLRQKRQDLVAPPSSASKPSSSTSKKESASRATCWVMTPPARTCAMSRTRFNRRLASLGVPRERLAISAAPSSSIATPSLTAECTTISFNSSGS